jgi:GT2 family glycosyltransferase
VKPETQNAPPVVAVVVVHEPGDWFEEVVDAFSEQDYPNLRFLFLVTGEAGGGVADVDRAKQDDPASDTGQSKAPDIEAMLVSRLDNAFVRRLGANPGFGIAANEVLRLVEGENGFFLFCHDDVAPDPSAIRVMVEELYRSNAGAVGPKLVEWDDTGLLLSVGLGLDRFGEIDQPVEPGEADQEQHDGVRDVFVLPTACMLVRADLFRELGGFDPTIDFHGEDVEFCWRAHHSGARLVVAPSARVRHRSELENRRPDLRHTRLRSRHRLRTVASLTGTARLPGRFLELSILTVAEMIVGLFTGRFGEGVASLRALLGLVPQVPSILARRRAVKFVRRVPEREVLGLQQRGSARLASFLRSRELQPFGGGPAPARRWRESTTAPVIGWIAVLALLAFGSRSFFSNGIPGVGEFLRFPASPKDLLADYGRGWNTNGIGATTANPTGWAALSALSVTTLFRMGLLQTVFVVGLVVVGLIGLWKLATVFPSTRARLGVLVVYAASPLLAGAFATGALKVLVAYAAVPWFVHTLRRAVGVETADPRMARSDLADGLVELSWSERIRRTSQFAIVVGLAAAFEPVLFYVAILVGLMLSLGTLLALAPWRTAAQNAIVTVAGVLGAALLNVPWIAGWRWSSIVGPPPIGDRGRGIGELASFQIGSTDLVGLTFAWYLPVIAALLLARAWRLTWAARAGVLVVGFGALAVYGDQGRLPVAAPHAGILLVPVAVGLAISAGAALAAFDLDVRGGSFGWRQPLGLAASLAVVVGLVPAVLSLGSGDWGAPPTPLSRLVEASLPDVPSDGLGDYHVLLLGDAQILPVPSVEYRDGVSFALMSDNNLDIRDRWEPTNDASAAIIDALDQIASGSTLRAGRLLAPLGVRFVVVPEFDGAMSTPENPIELPSGVVDALDEQLDIVSVFGLTTLGVYENSAWLPTYSLLTGATAEASRAAGNEALVRADLTSVTPLYSGVDVFDSATEMVNPGVLHVAVPFDDRWRLDIDGEAIEPRRAFGTTTAFDVATAGSATLSYDTASSRTLLLVVQAVLWGLALFAASKISVPLARRRGPLVSDTTLITFDPDFDDDFDPGAIDPGLQRTAEPEFVAVEARDDDHNDDDEETPA